MRVGWDRKGSDTNGLLFGLYRAVRRKRHTPNPQDVKAKK